MLFPKQLVALRKERGYTQQMLADKIGIQVTQIKRYKAGAARPTLEVFRKIVLVLYVRADTMLSDGMSAASITSRDCKLKQSPGQALRANRLPEKSWKA